MEEEYLRVLRKIINEGDDKPSRAGETLALFAEQMRFDLTKGFPALTTKLLAFKVVLAELFWFIEGGKKTGYRLNNNRLAELTGTKKTIWTENAESDYWKPKAKIDGDIGRTYGANWRHWVSANGVIVDQLQMVIDTLRTNPNDRRLVVSAWNPGELGDMALPPCHMLFHFFHSKENLSLHMVQRSCDMFLGVPFNIASYALLLEMVAQVTNMKAHELVITLDEAHIYKDHLPQVREQLTRTPYPPPRLWLNPDVKEIDGFKTGKQKQLEGMEEPWDNDAELLNYSHHPAIKARMAV